MRHGSFMWRIGRFVYLTIVNLVLSQRVICLISSLLMPVASATC